MEDIFEQFIESDKSKTATKVLKGLSMVFLVISAFFLSASFLIAIVTGLLALGFFILSFLSYVEYEYELFNDTITISKIYNESKRKVAKVLTLGNVRKVYENTNNSSKNKDTVLYYNGNIKGLSIYTFELNDNKKVEIALNDKLKRRIGIVYAQKIVRQF
ncbi:hypothetical protein ABFP60_06835 [Clostridioides difficile]